jgi:hypothetical protein
LEILDDEPPVNSAWEAIKIIIFYPEDGGDTFL